MSNPGNNEKRFVVAYIDFYNYTLSQELVQAETKQDARWLHSATLDGWDACRDKTDSMSDEQFQDWCSNSDFIISVIEIVQ